MKQGGDSKRQEGGNQDYGYCEQIDEQAIPQKRVKLTDLRCPGTQRKPESPIGQQREHQQDESSNTKPATPWIDGRNVLHVRRCSVWQEANLTTDPIDLFSRLPNENVDFASGARRAPTGGVTLAGHISAARTEGVLTLESQQHTQAVNFKTIGCFLRILPRQQSSEMVKENFPRAIMAEHLFLQRSLGPVGKRRILHFKHALVEQRHDRENTELVGFAGVAQRFGLLHCGPKRGTDAGAEILRVGGGLLLERRETQDDRKSVLVTRSQANRARRILFHRFVSVEGAEYPRELFTL